MAIIHCSELPDSALLRKHQQDGAYTDCFVTELAQTVSHAAFVEAFYTSPLFKIERQLLAWLLRTPCTDAQAARLAAGTATTFAAWRVEARCTDQLLLADFKGRTRSWLMVTAAQGKAGAGTQLFFGSAVLPGQDARSGQRKMGLAFRVLLGFHKLYSKALLSAARSRLLRRQAASK